MRKADGCCFQTRGRFSWSSTAGLLAPDVIALRGEIDTERAEDGEELVEADAGGVAELEGRQ